MIESALLIILGIVGLVIVAVVLYAIAIYNRLVAERNRYENAFSQIDVQLKRRYDLIPNLVEVAKGYMKHEQETLQNVIEARNRAFAAGQRAAAQPRGSDGHFAVRRRRDAAQRSPLAVADGRRGVPRPQGQHEHDGHSGGADLDRE